MLFVFYSKHYTHLFVLVKGENKRFTTENKKGDKMISMENFGDWLLREIKKRDWTSSDLAKAARISRGTLSNILSGTRGLGNNTINAIAKALKLPPEQVYRAAGFLPPKSEEEELIEKIKYIFETLPPEEQDNVIEYARMRRRLAEDKARYEPNHKRKPRPATG
jgi:transcriptional regulator with XRE-family HTH domain